VGKRQAGTNSRRQYERGASRMIAASDRLAEVEWLPASPTAKRDELIAYLGRGETLCEGTVSHYFQCARVAIERISNPDEEGKIVEAVATARGLLAKRAGVPETRRGASLKLRDPLQAELGDVFAYLRSKFIKSSDPLDLLLALYIIVMPRIGLRPVEITWTEWDGNGLYTYTAKRAGRPKRYIPHEHWPPVYKAALGLFIRLVPRDLDDATGERWRNVLAARLARASKWTRTKRRLSLYFSRHIAIANWKQAGITPEVIAKLAGHAGLRSQYFYASGRSGYGSRYVFLDADQAQSLLLTAADAATGQPDAVDQKSDASSKDSQSLSEPREPVISTDGGDEGRPTTESMFDVDDMPTPRPKKAVNSREVGERLWREAARQQNAQLERLNNDIAHIRGRRAQELPLRDKEADGRHQHDDAGPAGTNRKA